MKVLFVEDNMGDAQLMKEAFKRLSLPHEIDVVDDGTEVLPRLRREEGYADAPFPDIILLDLNMPKKSGIEVLAEVKKDPKLKHIPVVVLTSSQSPKDVDDCYRHQANSVHTKPFEFKGLMELVKMINAFWFEKALLPKTTA